jgi:NAD(P)-dependent dehydrogenase (short-subunit alcohol dehydrogenase family)
MTKSSGTTGAVVLTTGANSGIGLATAVALAREGYVSVGSVRSEAKAEALEEAAAKAGVEVGWVLLDVTDPEGCEAAVEDVQGRFGPIFGLVNNAGVGQTGAVEDIGDEEARSILETMVLAPVRLARLVLPGMRAAGTGRIVNVSSIYGRTTTPLSGWYQGAKHALEGVSDALRCEVAGGGIAVVLVEPGGFRTGIWDGDMSGRPGSIHEKAYERSRRMIELSMPFMGDPESCARVITRAIGSPRPRARYLVGPDARLLAVVGQVTPTAVRDRVSRVVLGL